MSNLNDEESGRHRRITAKFWGWRGYQPFVFRRRVYVMSAHKDYAEIRLSSFQLDAKGTPVDSQNHPAGTAAIKGSATRLATCVYRGQVYLFYAGPSEWMKPTYPILYKTSTSPANGWLPAGDSGFATGVTGSAPTDWGFRQTPPGIAAKEVNGSLLLVHYREKRLWISIFDGTAWKPDVRNIYDYDCLPQFAVCTAIYGGEAGLIVFLVPVGYESGPFKVGRLMVHAFDEKGTPVAFLQSMPLDYGRSNDMFSVVQGSVNDPAQANVVQIFCNNAGSRTDLRRIPFHVDSFAAYPVSYDTNIWSGGELCPCDVVPAGVRIDQNSSDFRQHLVVVATNWASDLDWYQNIASYPSDYFKCDRASPEVDAGNEPDLWNIIGVVEGAPPFSRNGKDSRDATSRVDYGISETRKVEVTTGLEMSITASASGGAGLFNVSSELARVFESTLLLWNEVKEEGKFQFDNRADNMDGKHGYILVLIPRLRGRRYTQRSYNEKHVIGTMYVVTVEDRPRIGIETYELEKPPEGMLPRKKTSDLAAWKEVTIPHNDDIKVFPVQTLIASLKGGGSKDVSLTLTSGGSLMNKTSLRMAFKQKTTLDQLFQSEVGLGFTYSYAQSIRSEFSQNVTANLELVDVVDKNPKTVIKLEVTPYWCVPVPGALLNPNQPPFWMPKRYVPKRVIPWCLTWKVINIDYWKGTEL